MPWQKLGVDSFSRIEEKDKFCGDNFSQIAKKQKPKNNQICEN